MRPTGTSTRSSRCIIRVIAIVVLMLPLGLLANPSAAASPRHATFAAPVFYPGPDYPASPVSADFNRDGIPDLAFTIQSPNGIHIFLGTANGSFTSGQIIALDNLALSVVTADLDRDGIVDLTVGSCCLFPLTTLRGNGDGTFQKDKNLSITGTSTEYPVVADFNGDGFLDIAALSYSNPSAVSLFVGDGIGGFAAGGDVTFGHALNPPMGTGDFNRDGISDLIVLDYTNRRFTVTPLFGARNGSFSIGPSYPYGKHDFPSFLGLAVADFNRDGALDIAVNGTELSIYLGNGDGTLRVGADYVDGLITYGRDLVVADFNGDGIPDLATTRAGTNVAVGVGDGTFQVGGEFGSGNAITLATIDINRDGRPDIVVANLPPSGEESFGLVLNTTPPPPRVSSISPAIGPANGGEFVTIRGLNFRADTVVIFDGVLAPYITVVSGDQIMATTPAHGAGAVDVTVTNSDGASVTLSAGYEYKQRPGAAPGATPGSEAPGGGRAQTGSGGPTPDPMPVHR